MENKLRCILFCSRNKDNKSIKDFKQRSKTFLSRDSLSDIKKDFEKFAKKGVDGEFSRLYVSVNARDEEKVKKQLIHELIDDNIDLAHIKSKLVSIASKSNCKLEKKWMFDFDSLDKNLLEKFVKDVWNTIQTDKNDATLESYRTPNGYAVIVNKGFDTRKLLEKYDFVELKRDDLLCIYWCKNDIYNINLGDQNE